MSTTSEPCQCTSCREERGEDVTPRIKAGKNIERVVAVTLQDGKWYVTREGKTVQVHARVGDPDSPYKFECGNNNLYTVEGNYFADKMRSDFDIMRPVYYKGAEYVNRKGQRIELTIDDDSPTYPLECDNHSYTRAGTEMVEEGSEYDLLDYAPEAIKLAGRKATLLVTDDITEDKPVQIGSHVSFKYDGSTTLTGIIRRIDGDNNAAVELDDIIDIRALPFSPWDCGGIVPSNRGWWVHTSALTVVPEGWAVAETSPEAPPPAAVRLLPREDRKLLWELYTNNVRISGMSMTQLIELRRELDAACER